MPNDIEAVAKDIVDAAFKVHKEFGPGLLESAYQQCHAYELRKRGRKVLTEVVLPIVYDGQKIDTGYRIDMILMIWLLLKTKPLKLSFQSTPRNSSLISNSKIADSVF